MPNQIDELIKQLDPDYKFCSHCKQWLLKEKFKRHRHGSYSPHCEDCPIVLSTEWLDTEQDLSVMFGINVSAELVAYEKYEIEKIIDDDMVHLK